MSGNEAPELQGLVEVRSARAYGPLYGSGLCAHAAAVQRGRIFLPDLADWTSGSSRCRFG